MGWRRVLSMLHVAIVAAVLLLGYVQWAGTIISRLAGWWRSG